MSKSKKNAKKQSAYGPAFFIRLGGLLLVAAIVGGGAFYDRAVLVPGADAKIEEIVRTRTSGSDDSRELVADIAGMKPSSTEQIGVSTVQEFRFGRVFPFLAPRICTVVFSEGGGIVEAYKGPITDADRDALAKQVKRISQQ
jgi:hypothetical protein